MDIAYRFCKTNLKIMGCVIWLMVGAFHTPYLGFWLTMGDGLRALFAWYFYPSTMRMKDFQNLLVKIIWINIIMGVVIKSVVRSRAMHDLHELVVMPQIQFTSWSVVTSSLYPCSKWLINLLLIYVFLGAIFTYFPLLLLLVCYCLFFYYWMLVLLWWNRNTNCLFDTHKISS